MDRYPIASTARLYLSFVEAGVGVTGQTPTIAIRRVSDSLFYNDSLASGSRFASPAALNAMTELDSTNFPGLYVYDFDHSEDATGSEMFEIQMSNVAPHLLLEYSRIAFGPMRTAEAPKECLLYGSAIKADGKPAVNDTVRMSIIPNTILSSGAKPGITTDRIDTFTDKNGAFSIGLIRGLTVRLQIPAIGYDRKIVIPDAPSANFADL